MAAKPPRPPASLLNSRNRSTKDTSTSTPASSSSAATESEVCKENNNKSKNLKNNNNNKIVNESDDLNDAGSAIPIKKTHACNCTNISIMHLFHEMKQEFPTIPDQIVAECVNENCHQRDNCILMLRNELELNPIPVQTFPTKVLQQQQQQQQQQHRVQQQSVQKPPTALKPIRAAPPQPNVAHQQQQQQNKLKYNNSFDCDSDDLISQVNSNYRFNLNNKKDVQNLSNSHSANESINDNKSIVNSKSNNNNNNNKSDMPSTIKASTSNDALNSDFQSDTNELTSTTTTQLSSQQQQQLNQPRARPTTLDLHNHNQQQQQLQRQQLKVQLQQHFQQRNQRQQQNLQQQTQQKQTQSQTQKGFPLPLRRAPLPPVPPKPAQLSTSVRIPQQQQQKQYQQQQYNESNLTSPCSSDDSELSVNVSLSSPTQQQPTNTSVNHPSLKTPPIRHRSVITVQPEPPYTRDFLVSPTSSTGSGSGSSQKSYTSVNLTLRQPNSTTPQATIDISAGPGFSGGSSSGLTYSSSSYDARRGCQKNFHITVTNEGGVFSASRILPHSPYYSGDHEQDNGSGSGQGGVNSLRSISSSEQTVLQQQYMLQQQQQQLQKQQQQHQQNWSNSQFPNQPIAGQIHSTLALNNQNKENMCCLPAKPDDFAEILQRQKARRDKLATALRENKRKLHQVEEEINVLTEPVNPGESERLDNEIQRLRSNCETLLNEIENARRFGSNSQYNFNGVHNNNYNNRQQQQQIQTAQSIQQQRTQQTSQPFPRPRPPRPPPPLIANQLDFIQHPTNDSRTPVNSLNSPLLSQQQLMQQQQQQYQNPIQSTTTTPATPSNQSNQQNYQSYIPSTDEEEYSDSNTDCDDESEEPLEMWSCNMCTFRNHPQLNICECCDFVRILPAPVLSREDIHITLSPGENRYFNSFQ